MDSWHGQEDWWLGILAGEEARERSLEKEREVEAVRQQLDTELARVSDCHREIDTYRSQLEDALRALDGAKGELAETKEEGEARVI